MKPTLTLCAAQETFIETVNTAYSRWEHRKKPGQSIMLMGHFGRTFGGAKKLLIRQVRAMGFTEAQIPAIIQDAVDVAELQRRATEDE